MMSLVDKILKESEENLFKPRRIEDRIEKIENPIERKIIKKYPINTEIKIYIHSLNIYLTGKIEDDPEYSNSYGKWYVNAYIYVNNEIKNVKPAIYFSRIIYDTDQDIWIKYGKFPGNTTIVKEL